MFRNFFAQTAAVLGKVAVWTGELFVSIWQATACDAQLMKVLC